MCDNFLMTTMRNFFSYQKASVLRHHLIRLAAFLCIPLLWYAVSEFSEGTTGRDPDEINAQTTNNHASDIARSRAHTARGAEQYAWRDRPGNGAPSRSFPVVFDREREPDISMARQGAFLTMPIPALLEALINDDGEATLWGAAALALRADEAAPHIEAILTGNDAYAQYSVARVLREQLAERHQATLTAIALDATAHPLARIGTFYALSGLSLDVLAAHTLLTTAESHPTPALRRAALIALSSTDMTDRAADVEALLGGDDPLCRIYAGRLLLEQGSEIAPDLFVELAHHNDYLVRQEAYEALGYYDEPRIERLLEKAAAVDMNRSAARAARLALFRRQIRSLASPAQHNQALEALMHSDDDHERWHGIQYALRGDNKALGMTALSRLAEERSPLGMMAAAQPLLTRAETTIGNRNTQPDDSAPLLTSMKQGALSPFEKHFFEIHFGMARYSVMLHNAQPHLPHINKAAEVTFTQEVVREDTGIRPVNHAHNPLTGRGFVRRRGFGGSARLYVSDLMERLDALHAHPDLSASELLEAWRLAGRAFHVLQDMASPLHVFSVWHVLNSCHFEVYWDTVVDEALDLVDVPETAPTRPSQLSPLSTSRLDAFTRLALEKRIAELPDTLMAHLDAIAWSAYYRASFWGEIHYADTAGTRETTPTGFHDGETDALPNILHDVFDGNIRYHTAWWGDYFELEDRLGNTFAWNRLLALDEWRPCPNPPRETSKDGHARAPVRLENGQESWRITGRFLFTHRGRTPYCHPFRYPDGEPMESHLPRYYGEKLLPLMVAYGNGWLATLAEQYPILFDAAIWEKATRKTTLVDERAYRERFTSFLRQLLLGPNTETVVTPPDWYGAADFLAPHIPRCGCRP